MLLTFSQILVPLIRTVEEVRNVVANAKFPPQGKRGFGSPFSMQNFNPMPSMTEYLQQANDSLITMVQIETKEALEVVDEIAPLVDVLFVGPFDLGNNIGHPVIDGVIKPELDAAIRKTLEAAKKADKRAGIYCTSGEQAKYFADMGFHMIHVATDFSALQLIMGETLAIAKGEKKFEAAKGY